MGEPKQQTTPDGFQLNHLKKLMDAGELSPEEYNEAVGEANPDDSFLSGTDLPPAPLNASQRMQAYKENYKNQDYWRPGAYVPGLGSAPTKDGSYWDEAVKKIPQAVRDFTLLPSHGPVYMEPSDAEVLAGLERDAAARGVRAKNSYEYMQEYRDRKWAEAHDAAKKRGVAIYRESAIDDESPAFMKSAKARAQVTRPVEAALRKADETVFLGEGFHHIDNETWKNPARLVREGMKAVGMPPPAFLGSDEDDAADLRSNLEQGNRVVEDSPWSAAAGGLGGAFATGGAGDLLSKGASKVIGQGTGLVGGMAKAGTQSFVAGGAESMGVSLGRADDFEDAGLEAPTLGEQAQDALVTGTMASVIGAPLGVPGGVSRQLRDPETRIGAAHHTIEKNTGQQSTKFGGRRGLRTPPGHAERSEKSKGKGAFAGARSDAANRAADDLMARGDRAKAAVQEREQQELARMQAENDAVASQSAGDYERLIGETEADAERELMRMKLGNEKAARWGAGEHELLTHEAKLREEQELASMQAGNDELANQSQADYERMMSDVRAPAGDLTDMLAAEHGELMTDVRKFAMRAVGGGELDSQETNEKAANLTYRLMNRVETERTGLKSRMGTETQAAMAAEGAPLPPVPGPNMHISELEAARAKEAEADYGLSTTHPSVSTAPIVDTFYDVLRRLVFDDNVSLPTSTHEKMKRGVDSLFKKKIVTKAEAKLYDKVAFDMKALEDDKVEILLPRRVSARELDGIIQSFDEMSKYASDSGLGADALRYRELGASARELRETSFKELSLLKNKHHMDLTEAEEMLTSIGLPPNATEVDPGRITQATTVLDAVRRIAETGEYVTPEGFAVPRKTFEKWLHKYDENLFDDYVALRGSIEQQKAYAEYDITVGAAPRTRAGSYKSIEDAVLGRDHDADALLSTFQGVEAQVESMRQRQIQQHDAFTILGIDKNMRGMPRAERSKLRVKMNQIMLEGGEEFDNLREAFAHSPEKQKLLDTGRQAAADMDSMVRKLGFGPAAKRPDFDKLRQLTPAQRKVAAGPAMKSPDFQKMAELTSAQRKMAAGPSIKLPDFEKMADLTPEQRRAAAETARAAGADVDADFQKLHMGKGRQTPGYDSIRREQLVEHLDRIFKNYEKFGESIDFDRSVREVFRDNPDMMKALDDVSTEHAFQVLRNDIQGGTKNELNRPYLSFITDFLENHLDAMVPRNPKSRSPLNVPAPLAMGLTTTIGTDDERRAGPQTLSMTKAMKALIRAVSLVKSEKKP